MRHGIMRAASLAATPKRPGFIRRPILGLLIWRSSTHGLRVRNDSESVNPQQTRASFAPWCRVKFVRCALLRAGEECLKNGTRQADSRVVLANPKSEFGKICFVRTERRIGEAVKGQAAENGRLHERLEFSKTKFQDRKLGGFSAVDIAGPGPFHSGFSLFRLA